MIRLSPDIVKSSACSDTGDGVDVSSTQRT